MIKKVKDFLQIQSSLQEQKKYFKENDKINITKLKLALENSEWENQILPCNYRQFDTRWILYNNVAIDRDRFNVMKHFINKDNLGILFRRQYKHGEFTYINIVDKITEARYMENAFSHVYVNPLYTYKLNSKTSNYREEKEENFSVEFRDYIDTLYNHYFTPEQILGYIYAILHSPAYRTKYAEFLKIDFPRIPFTENKELFEQISDLGWQLIQAHLLKPAALDAMPDAVHCTDNGDYTVEKIVFNNEKLFINKQQYFYPVSDEVYEFYIGGYQVLDKYLKDRKGRKLTLTETAHVGNIVKALHFTISQMKKIEALTQQWI